MYQERIRILILAIFSIFILGITLGRLYDLQVIKNKELEDMAEEFRIRRKLYPPQRGLIISRHGRILADNSKGINLVIDENNNVDVKKLEELRKFLNISTQIDKILSTKIVKSDLKYEDIVNFLPLSFEFPFVRIDYTTKRVYPYGKIASHIVGYVKLERPWQYKGVIGLEGYYDKILAGTPEIRLIEQDALGREIRVIDQIQGTRGIDIKITIDMRLQEYVEEIIKDKEAAVIVMDVHTGEILALASSPSFDPNDFSGKIELEKWRSYLEDKRKPLIMRAISSSYHPGSVFKVFVALAGLESEKISPKTSFFCSGKFKFGKYEHRCWKKEGHKTISLIDAITHSCDIYFYNLGLILGVDKIYEVGRKLGLGEKTGIDIIGEENGILPSSRWKREVLGEPWYQGENISLAVGQGYIELTPIEVARALAAIVNGGYLVRPHIVMKIGDDEIKYEKVKVDLSPQNLEIVKNAMVEVVKRGTAAYAFCYQRQDEKAKFFCENIGAGGKTGTAQVVSINLLEKVLKKKIENIKPDEIPYELRDHSWFAGFSPAENPEIVVVAIVEHGGFGAQSAAPIVRDVMIKYFELKGVIKENTTQ